MRTPRFQSWEYVSECKFIEHIAPNISCGTGYSEYDKFLVTFENGRIKKISVETWYASDDTIKSRIRKELQRPLIFDMGDHVEKVIVDNIDEALEMMYEKYKIKKDEKF